MEIAKIISHFLGLPATVITLLNIDVKTLGGWVTMVLSAVYCSVWIVRGWQAIRKENWEHKQRKIRASK